MNRPNVLVAAAGIILLLLACRYWRPALGLGGGVVLALVPVTARNLVVAGDLSPLASHGGLNFYIGNNPEADGTYRMVEGITPSIAGQREDARRMAEQALGRPLDDSEVSAYFYGRALSWMGEEPAAAARLFARKLAYAFNSALLTLNYSYTYYSRDEPTLLRFLPVGGWLLLPLGLLGLWMGAPIGRAERRAFWIWASFVPFYALSVALFFVSTRYQLPLLIALSVTAAGGLDRLAQLAAAVFRARTGIGPASDRGQTIRRLALALTLLVPLAVFTNWRFGLDDGRTEERMQMAVWYIEQQRFGGADALLAQIERDHPEPALLHFRLGRALLARGEPQRAITHLTAAHAHAPERPQIAYALGQALLDAQQYREAVPHLQHAFESGVREDVAGYDLARALAAVGDRAGALRVLNRVRPAREDDWESWYQLGQLAMQLEDVHLARTLFGRAAGAQPGAAAARRQFGLALALTGSLQEAARELEQAVRLDPRDPAAHLNLAVTYAELGRGAAARHHAGEALRLDPSYHRAAELLRTLQHPSSPPGPNGLSR